MPRGALITFEGPEGGGKSTQIALCAEWLRSSGLPVLVTQEPGGGHYLGEGVRELLLKGAKVVPMAEMFLFLADRAQHVASVVRPALQKGEIVLCDRFADSTTVYQGMARGLGRELAEQLNRLATGELEPDLTILLDLPPEVGLARLHEHDRLDSEPAEFHRKVREGFLQMAREYKRYRVVDAALPVHEVAARVRAVVGEFLEAGGYNRPSPP